MSIEVKCTCGKVLRAKTAMAGHKARCPSCGHTLTIPTPPAPGRLCPKCRGSLPDDAVICTNCGHDLRTGQKVGGQQRQPTPAAGTGPPAREPNASPLQQKGDRITVNQVFATTFEPEVYGEATALAVFWLLWIFGLVLALIGASIMGAIHTVLGIIGWLGYLAVVLRFYSWTCGKYFAYVAAYESGATLSGAPRGGLRDLGLALVVWAVGFGPAVVLFFITAPLAGLSEEAGPAGALTLLPSLGGVLVALAWAWLYVPMAMAVAGAYRSINPARVATTIVRTFPVYIMLLIYLSPFMVFVYVGSNVLMLLLAPHLSPLFALIVAIGVPFMALSYLVVAMGAMMGKLLRKYSQPKPFKAAELAYGLAWIGGAVGANVILFAAITVAGAVMDTDGRKTTPAKADPVEALPLPPVVSQGNRLPHPIERKGVAFNTLEFDDENGIISGRGSELPYRPPDRFENPFEYAMKCVDHIAEPAGRRLVIVRLEKADSLTLLKAAEDGSADQAVPFLRDNRGDDHLPIAYIALDKSSGNQRIVVQPDTPIRTMTDVGDQIGQVGEELYFYYAVRGGRRVASCRLRGRTESLDVRVPAKRQGMGFGLE